MDVHGCLVPLQENLIPCAGHGLHLAGTMRFERQEKLGPYIVLKRYYLINWTTPTPPKILLIGPTRSFQQEQKIKMQIRREAQHCHPQGTTPTNHKPPPASPQPTGPGSWHCDAPQPQQDQDQNASLHHLLHSGGPHPRPGASGVRMSQVFPHVQAMAKKHDLHLAPGMIHWLLVELPWIRKRLLKGLRSGMKDRRLEMVSLKSCNFEVLSSKICGQSMFWPRGFLSTWRPRNRSWLHNSTCFQNWHF